MATNYELHSSSDLVTILRNINYSMYQDIMIYLLGRSHDATVLVSDVQVMECP
jgi:hypothetical protein